ncbi:MAG: putative Holliday junction resolvase [Planctomycetota bacterium]|jgi:putative Holliday junction resolvase
MSDSEMAATAPWPVDGRIAGVDYGTVRIGLAVTDPDRRLASPWDTYERRSAAVDAAFFVRFASAERIAGFVVGLPLFPSGDESPKSLEARRFGRWLAEATGKPVVFFDERYSSAAADDFMAQGRLTKKRRQARRDQLAAQVLLSAFLESGQRPTAAGESLER